jgi:3',5'-cyclic AMP phosphodiesterase CpdA
VGDISVDGPANAANATAHLSATDTDRLIRLAGQRAGLTIDNVQIGDSGVSVKVGGVDSDAQLSVTGGALVLNPGVGNSIVLMQPKPTDPWSLQEAWVDADGLNVRALVDVTQITDNITGAS